MMGTTWLGFANHQNVQAILCLIWSFGPAVAETVTNKLNIAWILAPNNGVLSGSAHRSITLKLTSRTNIFAICTGNFFMTLCPPIHRTYRWTLGRYGRNKKQAFYKFHFLSKFECKLNGLNKQKV